MAMVKIALRDIDRIEMIEYKGGCSPKKIQQLYNPDFMINGILFDNKTRSIITNCKTKNTGKQGYLFEEDGIGVKDGKPIWTNKWDALKDDAVTGFVGSAPTIIVDGKIDIRKKDITSNFYGTTTYRSGIGFNDNELVLYSGGTRYNFSNYSKYIKSLGLKYFLNVDGGGSCCLWKNGKQINSEYDGRLIPMWILVYLKPTTPQSKPVITVKKEDDEVILKEKILVNNKLVELDTITKDGKTFIEMRELSTLLNAVVGYNATTKQKSITKK